MRHWPLSLLMLLAMPVAAAAATAPVALGIFDGWGAFRDATRARCYAIAAPSATIGQPQVKPYASVGYWPKSGIRGQFYVRLSKARAEGRDLRLTIGSRRFILTGKGVHGWASDARMDAAILAAMRSAPSMSVESRAAAGGAIADTYRRAAQAIGVGDRRGGAGLCADEIVNRAPVWSIPSPGNRAPAARAGHGAAVRG